MTVTNTCDYAGFVDHTNFGVGKSSYMTVTISVPAGSGPPITISIVGTGPQFADGTVSKTVPCQTGRYTIPLIALATPGYFHVRLDQHRSFRNHIRVVKPEGTVRTSGTISPDHALPVSLGLINPTSLGTNTATTGPFCNTMEIRFAMTPKDGCRCDFELGQQVNERQYRGGLEVGLHFGDGTGRLSHPTPSALGNLFVYEKRQLPRAFADDCAEDRAHLGTWLKIRNKGRFERCSSNVLAESHMFIGRMSPTVWTYVLAKSDVSEGHDILLSSQH